jgi:hypothetical protein
MPYAHRVVWEHHNGPLPAGWHVDHVAEAGCLYPDCIEIAHLEGVTPEENRRRQAAAKTRCRHGHPLSGENVRIRRDNGHRVCRACERNWRSA